MISIYFIKIVRRANPVTTACYFYSSVMCPGLQSLSIDFKDGGGVKFGMFDRIKHFIGLL